MHRALKLSKPVLGATMAVAVALAWALNPGGKDSPVRVRAAPVTASDRASPAVSAADAVRADISPAAADSLAAKLHGLRDESPQPAWDFRPIVITEVEANSYLKYRGESFLPKGVERPVIHIEADHVSGAADVNFDQAISSSIPAGDRTLKALAMLFSGRRRVAASGRLETGHGQAVLRIESATIDGTPLPQVLVDWALQEYLQRRYKIDLSKPIELPDHVARVELARGEATLIRSPDKR